MSASLYPFSQFSTESVVTPNRLASCGYDSPNSYHRFLMCSPSVSGSSTKGFGFNPLSRTATNGKKATRPCPCGYLGHPTRVCRDTPDQIARYRGRLSGPLLDRIDIQIEVPALTQDELLAAPEGESSAAIRSRVEAAREHQIRRQGQPNARLEGRLIDTYCSPDAAGEALLKQAIAKLNLSARAFHRTLKLARTIADLAGADTVGSTHLAEAIQYRRMA